MMLRNAHCCRTGTTASMLPRAVPLTLIDRSLLIESLFKSAYEIHLPHHLKFPTLAKGVQNAIHTLPVEESSAMFSPTRMEAHPKRGTRQLTQNFFAEGGWGRWRGRLCVVAVVGLCAAVGTGGDGEAGAGAGGVLGGGSVSVDNPPKEVGVHELTNLFKFLSSLAG